MDQKEIKERVAGIFRKTFNHIPKLTEKTSSSDIDGWDSLNHMILISEVEKEFGINFELEDILSMQSYGDIWAGVEKKLS